MPFKRFAIACLSLACVLSAAPLAAADPVKIVGLGDSLMAGYQLAPGESFPERLQEALKSKGHDVEVINAGVSGDTTWGGLARLEWSVPEDADLVLLELGANDMLRAISPDVTRRNLESMLEKLSARGTRVVLIGMQAAPNLGPDYVASFNAIYPDLAKKWDLELYPFFLDGVAAISGLLLEDGMHPNAKGVDRMVEGMMPMLEPIVVELAAGG